MKKPVKSTKVSEIADSKFKTKNINGIRHMVCANSVPGGKYWKNILCDVWEPVSNTAVSVICHRCVMRMVEPPKERIYAEKSDKPKGWKFMKEYVCPEGHVYHKGVVQPTLFGTLEPTVIEQKVDKKKMSRKEKDELVNSVGADIAELKSKLFSEVRKGERAKLTKELNQKTKQLKKLM